MDESRAVEALLDAHRTGTPIPPLTDADPDLSPDRAYVIQQRQVSRWQGEGRSVIGYTVGLTSQAVPRQLGVGGPDFGHLMDDGVHLEYQPIPFGCFRRPRVAPEIAFVLGKPLRGPGVTVARAIDAVDFVLPALEITDSRIVGQEIAMVDTIADNANSGGVVLGSTPTPLDGLDLRLIGCVLTRGGAVVSTGAGGAVLGSPLSGLIWLANTLGDRGIGLEAGHIVLPGALTRMTTVEPGDTFTATVAELGTVTAVFDDPREDTP